MVRIEKLVDTRLQYSPALQRLETPASAQWPFVFGFLEVREWAPGVIVQTMSEGEKCWTEYPESRGVINSYSDSSSD